MASADEGSILNLRFFWFDFWLFEVAAAVSFVSLFPLFFFYEENKFWIAGECFASM